VTRVPEVRIATVLKPYTSDPILRFKIRYQAIASPYYPNFTFITRGELLNCRLMCTSGTTAYRLFQAVKVNKIEIVTAIAATFQWKSSYGPTSNTLISGTSTTAAGVYETSPPRNSLASFWSSEGSNESEVVMSVSLTQNDYITVWYSAVIQDELANTSVTTQALNTTGQIYTTYLDGPRFAAQYVPVGLTVTT
jgi:hypothetical protein